MSSIVATAASLATKKKLTRIAIESDTSQFLEADATVSATHEGSAMITRHPVERGSDITDHIRREPDTVDIDIVISDTPVMYLASLRAKASVPGGNPKTRAKDAYDFLRRIKDNGQTVKVVLGLRTYRTMAIRSLSVTQDKDTSNIVRIRARFEEIIIAQTETVAAPEPVNQSRGDRVNQGKKSKVEATPKVDTKSQSLLTQGFEFLGGG
jgi:hypothetical protein